MAVAVAILGVVFYIASQRTSQTLELTTVVKVEPELCVEYLKLEGDNFFMKFHPFM